MPGAGHMDQRITLQRLVRMFPVLLPLERLSLVVTYY